MGIKKSEAKLTEPFVGKKEVIVMLSVQDGQSTASATKLDYDAVHALEQMIIDLTFTADTPQTDKDKVVCPNCGRSDYIRSFEKDFNIKNSEYRYKCINCNTYIKDAPQTDCETCKYGEDKHRYAHICNECGVGINNYTPQTELTAKCLNCHNAKACKENHWDGCIYEPQTDCGWK
jgi:hypothetical protein